MKNKLANDQKNKNQHEQLPFEIAYAQLEQIIMTLETEEKTLEETIELFERGESLLHHCIDLLNQAELRIKQLTGDGISDFEFNENK